MREREETGFRFASIRWSVSILKKEFRNERFEVIDEGRIDVYYRHEKAGGTETHARLWD